MYLNRCHQLALAALLCSGSLLAMELQDKPSLEAHYAKEEIPSTFTTVFSDKQLPYRYLPLSGRRDTKNQVIQHILHHDDSTGNIEVTTLDTTQSKAERRACIILQTHQYNAWCLLPEMCTQVDANLFQDNISLIILCGTPSSDSALFASLLKNLVNLSDNYQKNDDPFHIVLLTREAHLDEVIEAGDQIHNSLHGFPVTSLTIPDDQTDFDLAPLLHRLYRINGLPHNATLADSLDDLLAAQLDEQIKK